MTQEEIDINKINFNFNKLLCEMTAEYNGIIVKYNTISLFLDGILKDGEVFVYENMISFFQKKCIEKIKNELLKKQPKKIPYTLETFPKNAVLIRHKDKKDEYCIIAKNELYISCFTQRNTYFFEDIDENIEIGCQVIKDGKIEIEWLPFYREV